MSEKVPYVIIGGGVVGCAVANELSKNFDDELFLIEKNSKIRGENQSSKNSGVIHAGIYYPKSKGPLKARLCVEGNRMLYDFCEEHKVPYNRTGKLVVATNSIEEEYLTEDVLKRAYDNNVPDVKLIDGVKVKQLEPNVQATSAVLVPSSGIVEPTELVSRLHTLSESRGAYFVTGTEVVDIKPKGTGFLVTTRTGRDTETFETKLLINSGGLYSDEIAKMVNPDSPYEMEPVRGEAAKFYKTRRSELGMNGMNVYPAPYGFYNDTGEKADVSFKEFQRLIKEGKITKTVGVHLTPTFDVMGGKYVVGSTVTMGPTSTVGKGKEDYSSGLHPELHYLKSVSSFFPGLKLGDILLHQAGIRAKLKDYYDFVLERDPKFPNLINLLGIDSPGLTSSLAIAKYVVELIKQG